MDKREELMQIATKLFSQRGFENTPLSLICESANVSKGLISHHFKSKNGLLREIFMQTTKLIVEMNTLDREKITPPEQLLTLLESFFTQLEADKLLFQFNLNMMIQPNTREILTDLITERSNLILQSVREIFDEIDSERSLILSHSFIAELDGVALNYLAVYDDFPLSKIKEHMINRYRP